MGILDKLFPSYSEREIKKIKRYVDATYGRKTRAVIIMDSEHVILSSVQPETVAGRLEEDAEDEN